ncbi:uncharacterized protein LOC131627232 [Vicia villosa]|uniref:uncharacterized protein LOC131627232 n=1 Tax=Vicia villosa TaxID=3911 RepID=UPI00273B1BDE|nr:uncharacterized protein LOC131627232 [Vicia villosa]
MESFLKMILKFLVFVFALTSTIAVSVSNIGIQNVPCLPCIDPTSKSCCKGPPSSPLKSTIAGSVSNIGIQNVPCLPCIDPTSNTCCKGPPSSPLKNTIAGGVSNTGDVWDYFSANSVDKLEIHDVTLVDILTPEFLSSLQTSGLPNHHIKLKVGTPIMLMRNINQSEGLCNGTRLIITKLGTHVIEASIIAGKGSGNRVYIPRMDMSPSQSPWPFKLNRRQFPIIVSYAMTINKFQWQSLDNVGLHLPRDVFTHGQIYVALSRVTTKQGIKILIQC